MFSSTRANRSTSLLSIMRSWSTGAGEGLMSIFFDVFMPVLNCSKLCILKPRFPATKMIDFVAGIIQLSAVHLLVSAGELKVDNGYAKFKLKII